MRLKLPVLLILGAALLFLPRQAAGEGGELPLCMPGVYQEAPEDCLPLGPSAYLTEMAEHGLTFPIQPLPATTPEFSAEEIPYHYAKVSSTQLRIFATPEDAAAGEPVMRTLEPGLKYVTFIDSREIDGVRYYMLDPGWWVRRDEITPGVLPSMFVGLQFSETPTGRFGWTVFQVETQRNPSLNDPQFTGRILLRHDVVHVFDTTEAEGVEWVMIGPDEWLQGAHVGVVTPNPQAPEGVGNGRWIEINLYEQTLAVYENNQLVFATLTATGVPGFWTRPGLFQIQEKLESTLMQGSFEADRSDYYYLEDVPWTMYFDEARALHGAYWHNSFGLKLSHGCANLSPGDSYWLFQWAQVGDWVYVWDPSGQTPTDPDLYGEGGA